MNIEIGQYIPGNSFIHKLDPRTKILTLVMLMSAVFMKQNNTNLIIISIFVLACSANARLSVATFLGSIKATTFMLLFLLIINIFIIQKGDIVFTIPKFNIPVYNLAIYSTLYTVWRIVLSISLSIILTSTTNHLKLSLGLEKLFLPLKKIKIPVPTLAIMVSIALRFIPTVLDDVNRISNAQATRGMDFHSSSIKIKMKALFGMALPLLMASFQKADELALSMQVRNYNPKLERPRYRTLKMRPSDNITLALIFIYFLLLIIL